MRASAFAAVACVIASSSSLAVSVDESASLFQLAKAHSGKFISELPFLPKVFVLRFRPTTNPFDMASYDQQVGSAVFLGGLLVGIADQVFERCKNAGTFVGQNAFGVSRRVQVKDCERLLVFDIEGDSVSVGSSGKGLLISAGQYRSAKRDGVLLEYRFDVGRSAKQEVFTNEIATSQASISHPVELRVRSLGAYGRILSVTVFSSDGKEVLGRFDR